MKKILSNWDIVRIIRLVSGLVLTSYGVYTADSMLSVLGGLLILMAILN